MISGISMAMRIMPQDELDDSPFRSLWVLTNHDERWLPSSRATHQNAGEGGNQRRSMGTRDGHGHPQ
jgi:hypothetical protein